MKRLRALWVVAVVVGVCACGGSPADSPADVDAAGQNPQPTAVFKDDFEDGDAAEWQAVDQSDEEKAEKDDPQAE